MLIEVTQEDIEDGQVASCRWCPVARAVRRATGASDVRVGTALIIVDDREMKTPPEAASFMYRFDADRRVQPISFQLELRDNTGERGGGR